jgi:hypothetical protein
MQPLRTLSIPPDQLRARGALQPQLIHARMLGTHAQNVPTAGPVLLIQRLHITAPVASAGRVPTARMVISAFPALRLPGMD